MRRKITFLSLIITTLNLGITGCDPDAELDDVDAAELDDEEFRDQEEAATIPDELPVPAPGVSPEIDQLMTITINGAQHDIRNLLLASYNVTPRARITGAFRTEDTLSRTSVSSVSNTSVPAAQVYRCNGSSWVFQRPEAGLYPLLVDYANEPFISPDAQDWDHYRHPGDAAAPAAGPAWRSNSYFTSILGSFGQRFVGSNTSPDFVSVANPAAPTTAIPLLRVPASTQGAQGLIPSLSSFSANLPNGRGFVFRLGTVGGRAPASCTAGENGQELRVPYSTDYYFVQLTES